MLDLLAQSWNSLRKNPLPVLLYILITLLVSLAYRLSELPIEANFPKDSPPAWIPLFILARDVLLTAFLSALQATVFAVLGKEIDRPLWKCAGWRDALRRFFITWFILNLLAIMIIRLQIRAHTAGVPDVVLSLEFFLLLVYLLGLPVGACVMYWGRLNWSELPEALTPIIRVMPLTLLVLLLGGFQWLFHLTLPDIQSDNKIVQALLLTALDFPLPFLDCLAFAAMWRICMLYRDAAFDSSNDSFDI